MKRKLYTALIIVTLILMGALIFVMAAATDFRDVTEFTPDETVMFYVFLASEYLLFFLLLVFASLVEQENMLLSEEREADVYDKKALSRGILLVGVSFLVSILFTVFGMLLREALAEFWLLFTVIMAVGTVLPILLFVANLLLLRRYADSIKEKGATEVQNYVYSQREYAEKSAETHLAKMKKIRLLSDIYAIVLAILSLATSFAIGVVGMEITVVFNLVAVITLVASLSRIRALRPDTTEEDNEQYKKRSDYPELYLIAEGVRDTLGVKGEVRIALGPDNNAAIRRDGRYISIYFGVLLLGMLSRDELIAILYHELGHLYTVEEDSEREARYNSFLEAGGIHNIFSPFTERLFSFVDATYALTYFLFNYASSIYVEERADRIMGERCDRSVAASALLRINYYTLFEWEETARDYESFYLPDEPRTDSIRRQISEFCEVLKDREGAWSKLVRGEIISRIASHPTINMRIASLGVEEYRLVESGNTEEYIAERDRAIAEIEGLLRDGAKENYTEQRHQRYELPLEEAHKWEAEGRPLDSLTYRDVIEALAAIGRINDAEELAKRAIAELSDSAACFATFYLGVNMLHRFDEGGIEYIYKAIENNDNYIEEGLETLGRYCCLAGKQDELDKYRKRALEIVEERHEEIEECARLNKGDTLAPETLEGDMLGELVKFIDSVDEDRLDEVYLVRKVINDSFFTSCVILRVKKGVDDEAEFDLFHRVFTYLDTSSDWQYSLFDYRNVPTAKLKRVEGSLIWSSKASKE